MQYVVNAFALLVSVVALHISMRAYSKARAPEIKFYPGPRGAKGDKGEPGEKCDYCSCSRRNEQ